MCPAQESQCNYCHKIGHWENACLQKQRTMHKGSKQKSAGRQKQKVHELHREEPSDIEFNELNFDCIDTSADGTEAYANIKIKPFKNQITNLHGKIDIGSQGNVLPLRTYHKMYPDDSKHIKHSSTLLTYTTVHLSSSSGILRSLAATKQVHNEQFLHCRNKCPSDIWSGFMPQTGTC